MKIGGVALIAVGVILLIENTDSFPFLIVLFVAGIILIAFAFHKEKDPKQILLQRCNDLIDLYEATPCKAAVMQIAKKISESNIDLAGKDADKVAHFFLMNQTAKMLSSGQYHIGYGQLNPIGLSPSIRKLHDKCADWLLEKGYITKDELNEHEKLLREAISTVG